MWEMLILKITYQLKLLFCFTLPYDEKSLENFPYIAKYKGDLKGNL